MDGTSNFPKIFAKLPVAMAACWDNVFHNMLHIYMIVRHARTPIAEIWVSRVARLQPWYLLTRYQNRWTRSLFAFVNACISIGIMSAAALLTGQPLIFPSLGPTAFLCFYVPSAASSAPRNVILSHGAGVLVGWLSLWAVEGILGSGSAGAQIGAVGLSLGLISALMIAADIPHPPAASTTLIVSLGLIGQWQEFVALMIAVVLLTAQAFIINRLCGVCYPLWKSSPERETNDLVAAALATESTSPAADPYAQIANQLVARQSVQRRQVTRVPIAPDSGLQIRLTTADGQTWMPQPVEMSLSDLVIEFTDGRAPVLAVGTRAEVEMRLAGNLVTLSGEVRRRRQRQYSLFFPVTMRSGESDPPKALRAIFTLLEKAQA